MNKIIAQIDILKGDYLNQAEAIMIRMGVIDFPLFYDQVMTEVENMKDDIDYNPNTGEAFLYGEFLSDLDQQEIEQDINEFTGLQWEI